MATKHDAGKPDLIKLNPCSLAVLADIRRMSHAGSAIRAFWWWWTGRGRTGLRDALAHLCSSGTSRPFTHIFRVMEKGAEVYGWDNYLEDGGLAYSRLASAFLRHVEAYIADPNARSDDFCLPHLDHALACLHMLVTYTELGMTDNDDRPKKESQE